MQLDLAYWPKQIGCNLVMRAYAIPDVYGFQSVLNLGERARRDGAQWVQCNGPNGPNGSNGPNGQHRLDPLGVNLLNGPNGPTQLGSVAPIELGPLGPHWTHCVGLNLWTHCTHLGMCLSQWELPSIELKRLSQMGPTRLGRMGPTRWV